MSDNLEHPKTRATPQALTAVREAAAFLKGHEARLAVLQEEVAFVHARAAHMLVRQGKEDRDLAKALSEIENKARRLLEEFDAEVLQLSPSAAGSTTVLLRRKAIMHLLDRLNTPPIALRPI